MKSHQNISPLTRRELLTGLVCLGVAGDVFAFDPLALENGAQNNASRAPRRWVVLVGVARYAPSPPRPGDPRWRVDEDDLRGPENDIPAMIDLLEGKYDVPASQRLVLRNANATGTAIRQAWDWLAKNAQPGDQAIFYFSGHGTLARRPQGDPGVGKYTSALCPHDARRQGTIPGYEIGRKIDVLEKKGVTNIVVIVDACDSGSASRDPFTVARYLPLLTGDGILPPSNPDAGGFVPTDGRRVYPERYMGAAQCGQEARDAPLLPTTYSNRYMGAFTFFLLQHLRKDGAQRLTYAELVRRIQNDLTKTFKPSGEVVQKVEFHGSTAERERFLQVISIVDPKIVSNIIAEAVSVRDKSVTLRPLAAVALTVGSVLEVRTEGTTRQWIEAKAKDTALVRVTTASKEEYQGTIVRGTVAVGDKMTELSHVTRGEKLRVMIAPDLQSSLSDVRAIAGVELVTKTDQADVALLRDVTGQVLVYKGLIHLPPMPVKNIPTLLRQFAAIKPVLELQNPQSQWEVSITVDGVPGSTTRAIDDKYTYTISSEQDGYLTILALAANGKITGISGHKIMSNTPYKVPVTVTGPVGLDVTKVIVTKQRLSLSVPLTMEEAEKDTENPARTATSLLDQLRSGINAISDRGTDFIGIFGPGVAIEGWASTSFYLRIEDPC